MNTINTVKKQISELELEVSKLENVIAQVKGEISTTTQEISGFEFTCSNDEFDEYLDECCEPVKVFGMEFFPSDVLKQCDPIAYHCAKSEYEGTKDLEDVPAYVELTEKLEELESELDDQESSLEDAQCELESLEDELDELLVIDVDYIEDVQTVVVTLEDKRTVQVQFEKETNRLHADYGTYSAHIDKCNVYGLDLSELEESLFNDWIATSEVIQDVLNKLNNN